MGRLDIADKYRDEDFPDAYEQPELHQAPQVVKSRATRALRLFLHQIRICIRHPGQQ